MSEERLSRIESKLDQLAEAISSIARVEEKIYASSHRIDRLEFRLDKQEEALINLKTAVEKNSDISKKVISENCNISEVTINKCYKKLLENKELISIIQSKYDLTP